ncbi:MAG: choice-of-anchor D domain-containing protein [Terriglobales bacterium]
MRLPQSIIRSLFVRNAHSLTVAAAAILVLGIAPLGISAQTLQLTSSPSNLRFGGVAIGQTETLLATLTNNQPTSVTINGITVGKAQFSTSLLNLPLALPAGQSVSLTVSFTPTGTGWEGSTIEIFSTASNSTLQLQVEGSGVSSQSVTASPSMVSFGQVAMGSSFTLPLVLTNMRSWNVTLSAAQITGAGFSLSGPSFPLTLGARKSVTLNVTFTPPSAGTATGGVFVSGPGLNVPLTGTGAAPGQLTSNPSSVSFGNVEVGGSQTQSVALSNTGPSSLTISAAAAGGTGFSLSGLALPFTLAAGQSTSFNALFSPTAGGAASGSVTITSNGSDSSLSIALSGTGVTQGTLTANPTSLAFGSVQVGNSTNLSETLTNTGGSAVTISQANLTGAMFAISGLTLPQTLNPNQSVTFTATFTPTGAGGASGSLSVVSTASNSPLTIALTGTGTSAGTLAVSPTSLSFGNVVVGTSASLNGSLTASGASVTVQPTSPSNGEFVLSGIALPQTIPAGQSATFTVTFTPQSSGATSASLSFPSNASNSPTVQTMTGTGTAAPVHTVLLTWNASGTGGITSYNVYRAIYAANSCGSYSNIASTPGSTTTYTDSAVTDGTTYCYATTAVDPEGESAYSNIAEAAIPAP